MQARATRWIIGEGDAEVCVEISDNGAGEFLEVQSAIGEGSLAIDPDEWPAIRAAIDHAFSEIKRHETAEKVGES